MDVHGDKTDAALEVDMSAMLLPDLVKLCRERGESAPDVLRRALNRVMSRTDDQPST